VYDLIYNPPETALIRLARQAGLPFCGGLGMLVEQAALAFERWTAQPASRSDMLAAVADLKLLESTS
jgi:shikimate dehydrogenase